MPNEFLGNQGELPEGKFSIVVSRYNESITGQLLAGAISTLTQAGVADQDIDVVWVSGAWELPLPTSYVARNKDVLAVIALGAVIKGETTHDEHINRSVCDALMEIGLATCKPILLGLLTCNTVDQAIQRAGGNVGNKGSECASAAIEMVRLMHRLQESGSPKVGFRS